MLYIEYLEDELRDLSQDVSTRAQDYFQRFCENLAAGVEYYRELAESFGAEERERFLEQLEELRRAMDRLFPRLECACRGL